MLIKALLELVYWLLNIMFVFDLPDFPDSFMVLLSEFIDYVMLGMSVLGSFIGASAMKVLGICVTLVFYAHSAYLTISILFWFLRKIPMLNIRE